MYVPFILNYIRSQQKQKVAPEDNEAEDTVSFNYWNFYTFNPGKTSPLTGDETLTLLNTVLAVRNGISIDFIVKIKFSIFPLRVQ